LASTLNASTSSGLISSGDTSGVLQLQTANTTALTVDGSQNIGIGVTPSAWGSGSTAIQNAGKGVIWQYGGTNIYVGQNYYFNGTNRIYTSTAEATEYQQGAGLHRWYYAPSGTAGNTVSLTEAMRIDNSGNVGIGTTSPSQKLEIATAAGGTIGLRYIGNSGYATVGTDANNSILFSIGNPPTERMRINASGNLLVGATSGVGSEKINVTQTASDWVGQFVNNNATQAYCIRASTGTYYFNTSSLLYDGLDFGNLRFRVYTNGGIANYSANNSNLSDQREKKDIEFAPNYLNKICQIPVKTFFYNQQTDTEKNLGAIAQDVQAICPELVTESNWGTEEEPKMRLSIYQTDLQYALMKSIQELKAINDTQAETINALTARIVALEGK
jgi:hypothetical protein